LAKRSLPWHHNKKNQKKCPAKSRETASTAELDLSSRFAWSSASGSQHRENYKRLRINGLAIAKTLDICDNGADVARAGNIICLEKASGK